MLNQLSKRTKILIGLYLLFLAVYAVFSYGLTASNLILINADWFQTFQNWMWQTFYNQREVVSRVQLVFLLAFFSCYFLIINSIPKKQVITQRARTLLIIVMSLPLLFSYNSLSHDVFNYIFNSRMIIEYQANPHVKTAIEFSHFDDWTRFMHNIHTPAPYGYGWTALSLLPYIAGFGKFILTWLNFRWLSIFSLVLSSLALSSLSKILFKKELSFRNWALFFFNPLVLVEVVSNFHNDLWMMFPVILAFTLQLNALDKKAKKKVILLLTSWLLFGFSVWIKFASLALVPIMIILTLAAFGVHQLILRSVAAFIKRFKNHIPLIASILMFLPLFTLRSQQFHPWYLLWPLVWLPLIQLKSYKILLIIFSITSLVRYYPWMLANDYSEQILTQQKIVTWLAIPISIVCIILFSALRKKHAK